MVREGAGLGVLDEVDAKEVSEGSFLGETETFGVEIFKQFVEIALI